ncbi:MAG: DUF3108 domain-containing protein [Bernardetiaceae bacterium]
MKAFLFFGFIFTFSIALMSQPKSQSRLVFPEGEQVTYLAHYGFINAGEARISLDKNATQIDGKTCHKVAVEGRTTGVFRLGMRVDDLWQSYIDARTGLPQQFFRDIKENKYTKVETVQFDQQHGKAHVRHTTKNRPEKQATYDMLPQSQDMISGYYYLRGLNFDAYQAGDTLTIPAFFEDKPYHFQLRYLGRERVRTKIGTYDALVMAPLMPASSIFDGQDAIKFWISDDQYRIPLKIRANMFIGAVQVEVTEYKNQYIHLK